jgi:membrane protein YdbS with pleckstrin-like domain
MSENKPAMTNEITANKRQRRLTIFDVFPLLIALAVAAFSADYAATRFGVLASIAAFVVVAVLAFFVVGYAFHICYSFVSWICRVIK